MSTNPPVNLSTSKSNTKKKGTQDVERNYEIRPKLIMKFTREKVYDVIKNVLDQKMQSMKGKYNHEDAMQLNKEICDEVKVQLKEDKMNFKRYKILVHCIIGEKKGQGIKLAILLFLPVGKMNTLMLFVLLMVYISIN